MTEWGVRLEEAGCEPVEFKVPTGEPGAEVYANAVNTSVLSLMTGDKATVVTRATADDPWKVAGRG